MERYNLNAGNTGMGIGIIHYINFPTRQNVTVIPDTYFNDHFKLRSDYLIIKPT
jgi:hypothetical protein